MIGNDVVDLALAKKESNWKRRGFLDKIFTAGEQELIACSSDSEIMVWTLWSMKEAAYKIYNRETGVRAFMPHKLQCTIREQNDGFKGRVNCNGRAYSTKSIISGDQIHTVAVLKRSHLELARVLKDVKIKKDNNGLPYLDSEPCAIISRSHHGRYNCTISLSV